MPKVVGFSPGWHSNLQMTLYFDYKMCLLIILHCPAENSGCVMVLVLPVYCGKSLPHAPLAG